MLTFRNDDNWYNTSLTDMLSDNEGVLFEALLLFFISATFYNKVTCILIQYKYLIRIISRCYFPHNTPAKFGRPYANVFFE